MKAFHFQEACVLLQMFNMAHLVTSGWVHLQVLWKNAVSRETKLGRWKEDENLSFSPAKRLTFRHLSQDFLGSKSHRGDTKHLGEIKERIQFKRSVTRRLMKLCIEILERSKLTVIES